MRVLAVVIVLVAMLGCDQGPVSPSDLRSGTWRLVLIERAGTPVMAVPEPTRYTIQFLESGRVSVRADCNTCGGAYTLSDTALSVGPLACTRVACGAASLDSVFAQALGSTHSLLRSASGLMIRGDSVTLHFRND